ncbi:MAG: calcium-binding protein [bacterium]
MTTVTVAGMWVQWNEAHTAITDFGVVEMGWVGSPVVSYSYQDGWTGGAAPAVQLLPTADNLNFTFGDGSVRTISNITDGTSNTIFVGETAGDAPFSGNVIGVRDTAVGIDYYFGLDGALPTIADGDTDGAVQFINDLTSDAGQIGGGAFAPGVPILLDGTSNTIAFTENDRLQGDRAAQHYEAGIGRDVVHGAGGRDYLDGGDDRDRLYGDDGSDTVLGGGGRDMVSGGGSDDLCHGGGGNDTVFGGRGDDQLFGGDPRALDHSGSDALYGGAGHDSVYGGYGNDTLDGGAGTDGIFLGHGADYLIFAKGSGHDECWDFSVSDGDVLVINRDLLSGQTTGQEVIDDFGTVLGDGSVRFLFGHGDVLTLRPHGNITDGLSNTIIFAE